MRRTRSSHGFFPHFHHSGLLFLAAVVVLVLILFYGCTGGPVYGPQGRLIFLPMAQAGGRSMTLAAPMKIFLQKVLDFTFVR